MARRMLIVGVGGSGAKTLRFTKDILGRRLKAFGVDRIPAAWQFLAVDLPPTQDRQPGVPAELDRKREYVGLAHDQPDFAHYDSALRGNINTREDYARWRVNPAEIEQLPYLGAGQIRLVGRVVAADQLGKVKAAVTDAANAFLTDSMVAEMRDLPNGLGAHVADPPIVLVVGSIAGGTGSGAMMDVCDVIMSQINAGWAKSLSLFAYLPPVFDNLPEGVRSGLDANTYFALSELLNGRWDQEGEAPYLALAGLNRPAGNRGPRYNFLVGRGGGTTGVNLDTDIEVYKAVGELFAELTMDGEYASAFDATTRGNFATQHYSLKSPLFEGFRLPCASLGFSRLGMGRDRFARYASERLVRRAVQRVATGHLDRARDVLDQDELELLNPDQIAGRVVGHNGSEMLTRFISDCGLSERGVDSAGNHNNAVLDRLIQKADFDRDSLNLRQAVTGAVQGHERGRKAVSFWLRRFPETLRNEEKQFLAHYREAIERRGSELASELSACLAEQVSNSLFTYGGSITAALLEGLEADVQGAISELTSETGERRSRAAAAFDTASTEVYSSVSADVEVALDHPALDRALSTLVEHSTGSAVGMAAREVAVGLLSDLLEQVIRPLTRNVKESVDGVRRLYASEEFRELSSEHVGAHLLPSATEVFLLDPDEYADTFAEQLMGTVGEVGNYEDLAIAKIVEDEHLSKSEQRELPVVRIAPWPWEHRGRSNPPALTVNLSKDRLIERATLWMRSDPTAGVGAFLHEDLESYLRGDGVPEGELISRFDRFSSALDRAVNLARPLVSIDQALVPKHMIAAGTGGSAAISYSMTPLPFQRGTPAGQAAEKVLLGNEFDASAMPECFDDGSGSVVGRTSVSISSQSAPLHPLCLSDYQRRVSQRWRADKSEGRSDFGYARRGRRRLEAVPLPRQTIEHIVLGWELSRFVGAINLKRFAIAVSQDVNRDGYAAEVLAGGRWLQTEDNSPDGPAHDPSEALPAMLESFGLTQILHASAENPPESLEVFDHLNGIGRLALDTPSSGPVKDWVETGELPQGAIAEIAPAVANSPSSREARLETLNQWVTAEIQVQSLLISGDVGVDSYMGRVRDVADTRQHVMLRFSRDVLPTWEGAAPRSDGPIAAG